jgi:hypothetical protein
MLLLVRLLLCLLLLYISHETCSHFSSSPPSLQIRIIGNLVILLTLPLHSAPDLPPCTSLRSCLNSKVYLWPFTEQCYTPSTMETKLRHHQSVL